MQLSTISHPSHFTKKRCTFRISADVMQGKILFARMISPVLSGGFLSRRAADNRCQAKSCGWVLALLQLLHIEGSNLSRFAFELCSLRFRRASV